MRDAAAGTGGVESQKILESPSETRGANATKQVSDIFWILLNACGGNMWLSHSFRISFFSVFHLFLFKCSSHPVFLDTFLTRV